VSAWRRWWDATNDWPLAFAIATIALIVFVAFMLVK